MFHKNVSIHFKCDILFESCGYSAFLQFCYCYYKILSTHHKRYARTLKIDRTKVLPLSFGTHTFV